jgi:hypothetical protein
MTDDLFKPKTQNTAREYQFGRPQDNEYKVFPDELEDDPEIFFHGTEERVLESIRSEGFRFPAPPKAQSVSFSRVSSLALGYASDKRSPASPNGCVIAVRLKADDRSRKREEAFGLHVESFDPQPEIVGYCIVPASYDHL